MKQLEQIQIRLMGDDIVYRGEGNANLVVSLTNKAVVLRFPKSKFCEKSQEEKLQRIEAFINRVMLAYLGDTFIHPVSIVQVSQADMQILKASIQKFRPSIRLNKDIFYPKALLLPDYTVASTELASCTTGPTLSIELKPKMGYYFPRNCVHPTLCNFCLKQFYKYQQGITHSLSGYCPLDLFSGDPDRMLSAIEALLQSPQNNLRLFGNGEILHTEESTNTDRCVEFLQEMFGCAAVLPRVLLHSLLLDRRPICPTPAHRTVRGEKREVVEWLEGEREVEPRLECRKSAKGFPPNCLLNSILAIQKNNVITDSEALLILHKLLGGGDRGMTSGDTKEEEELQDLLLSPPPDPAAAAAAAPLLPPGFPAAELEMLRNYLLAATAKDLSIIITIRRGGEQVVGPAAAAGAGGEGGACGSRVGSSTATASPLGSVGLAAGNLNKICIDNTSYWFTSHIIDMDPKHIHRISKYVNQKKEWLSAFRFHSTE